MNSKELENHKALMQKQAENTRSWANMANEDNAKLTMGPASKPATYKAKTYLPDASKWATKQASIEEASRAMTPNSISQSNMEEFEDDKRSYDRYRERMGLSPRADKTPSRERRRTARRQSPRRQSPRRRSPSPTRRYGVGRRYVRASSPRRRSPSPRYSRRRSPSPRRRSPSPRYSRRRSPSRSPSRRRSPSRHRGYSVSPLRYTVAANGRTVNEFGRDIPIQRPRYNTRKTTRWNV